MIYYNITGIQSWENHVNFFKNNSSMSDNRNLFHEKVKFHLLEGRDTQNTMQTCFI